MGYLYTMEFYSATKKNEILSFTSKWMELDSIILSEASQAQKAKNHICYPTYVDYRPKTNTVILLDTDHTLRG
jgi:phosphoenolpyruvate synthase/pyruvate phosphate dikinase